jgi:hypothetical protein
LHCADEGDKGGNARHVIFDGHPDNLHLVWDAGLRHHISRNGQDLAAEVRRQITVQDRAAWDKESIEGRIMEHHRLPQTVAYRDLGGENSAVVGPAYEQRADPAVELHEIVRFETRKKVEG